MAVIRKLRDIALALLVVFFPVSNVHAGPMSSATDEIRMPRLMIIGALEAQYEDLDVGTKDNHIHTYGFTELFTLTARGFLVDRRLIHYSLAFDYQTEQGNTPREGGYKSVGLEMVFLPHRPFNAEIRASYLDGQGYDVWTAGFTLAYIRKTVQPVVRAPQQLIMPEKLPEPAEKDSEDEGEEEQKPVVPEKIIKAPERGFLYYFLPKIFVLDFDSYSSTFSHGSNTTSYDARLSMRGDYGKTLYFVTIEDINTINTGQDKKGSSENVFFSDLSTVTGWRNAVLRNKAFLDANNTMSYGLTTDLEGKLPRKWDYTLSASYLNTVTSVNTTTYGVAADAGSTGTLGRTQLSYRFGAAYQHGETDSTTSSDASARGGLGTSTPLSRTATLSTESQLTMGTAGSTYSFRVLGNYRPWERFYLFASYSIQGAFSGSSFNNSFNPVINSPATTASDQKGPVHTAQAGLQYYYLGVTLSGTGTFEISPSTEAGGVSATAAGYLFNRVNVALGGTFSWTNPRQDNSLDAEKTRNYNIYNVITAPFFFRNSTFLMMSTYTRSESLNLFSGRAQTSSLLTFNPVFRWLWRRLSIEIDGQYTVTRANNGPTETERRILIRVRRPFRVV